MFASLATLATAPGAASDAATAIHPRAKRVYHATRIAGAPPVIDGRLDDACWSDRGTWSGDYTQQEPDEGQPASQATELKILYDDRHLYVAIRAFDTELATVPHLRGKRDEFTGDMVGITFDSYHDRRTAFEFNVTSGGSKIDLQIRDDDVDLTWNAVWDGRVAYEPDAWTAEYRIPFSQLRYARQAEQVWGLHSWRWIKRRQEESDWNPIPQDHAGMVFEFGELRGIEDLPPVWRLELLPYAVARHERLPREPGNPYRDGGDAHVELGLDVKLGLTSDFTLDVTLNPDFGQIEADPSEINLTTFETFQEERRPFFVEGKGILDWEVDEDLVFYSRRIGQAPTLEPESAGFIDQPTAARIRGAAKLTGKTRHGFALGALYASTARANARIFEAGTERRELAEPATQFFVARGQQEFAAGGTTLGGIATATRRSLAPTDAASAHLPEQALTGGLDLLHRWGDRNYELFAAIMGSRVEGAPAAIAALMADSVHNFQRPDASHIAPRTGARELRGHGGEVRAGRVSGGRWRYFGHYDWRSPGLELNDAGFLAEADRQAFAAGIEYVVTQPGPRVRSYEISLEQTKRHDFGGVHLASETELSGEVRFNSDWTVRPAIAYTSPERDTHMLRGGPSFRVPAAWEAEVELESPGTETWRWQVEIEHEEWREGGSRRTEIAPGFTWRALGLLTVQPALVYETARNDVQYVATTPASPGGASRFILGRMEQRTLGTTVRVDVNFTPNISLAWYGSLFVSSGDFSALKRVTNPLAARYENRFRRIDDLITVDPFGEVFTVTEEAETYALAAPGFDVRELQSNLVLRWEYRAGSTLYLVWTQHRESEDRIPGFSAYDDYRRLLRAPAGNTFLLKWSYWFSR